MTTQRTVVWEVAVRKAMKAGPTGFQLDSTFSSSAQRLVLFGPSGAGKSLTLRAMAGLLRPDAGRIAVAGTVLFASEQAIDVPAERRGLGYLFQEYALFPHLTVRQNVAFGISRSWRNPRRGVAAPEVDRWLDAFELSALAHRYPDQLSGGQRQRTALARALVTSPRALLLDEPFAALDVPLRRRLRAELLELQQRLGIPTLLITHDEDDVAAFADDVIRVDNGATHRPRSVPVSTEARKDEDMKTSARNRFDGVVTRVKQGAINDEVEIGLPGGQSIVAVVTRESADALGLRVGAAAFALIKASSVIVATDLEGVRLSARNRLQGKVAQVMAGAVNSEVVIDVDGAALSVAAVVTQESARTMGLVVGAPVTALFKASSVVVGVRVDAPPDA